MRCLPLHKAKIQQGVLALYLPYSIAMVQVISAKVTGTKARAIGAEVQAIGVAGRLSGAGAVEKAIGVAGMISAGAMVIGA